MLAARVGAHKLGALPSFPAEPGRSSSVASWRSGLIFACVLALHAWLALSATAQKSTTVDEMAHLTAGHALWAHGDYRLQPENGVLPQLWEGVPAVIRHRALPPLADLGWKQPNVWSLGHVYFHQLGNDLGRLLRDGRAMNIGWSLATGVLVFAWARRLFGTTGAWIAFLFWAFCPTFLAHSALATSDMAMTFFMLASITAYDWRLRVRSAWSLGVSAVLLGLAFVCKYSAVLLIPMCGIVAAARIATILVRDKSLARREALRICGDALVQIAAVAVVVWAFHRFRFLPVAPESKLIADYTKPWAVVLAELGSPVGPALQWARTHHLLPDAYLYGFGFVLDLARTRGAFLNGEISLTGWGSFFPYAFLFKTPVALLSAGALSVVVVLLRWTRNRQTIGGDLRMTLPLAALFVVYWLSSITSHLNIGQRHLLPTYPVLFIAAGALGWAAVRWRRGWRFAPPLLLAGQVAASSAIRPDYLAFFNVVAGGPRNGYRHLVDSSLDWGQDLPGLARWLAENRGPPSTPVYLAYFGTGDPSYYRIKATPMVPLLRNVPGRSWYKLEPGLYCISATLLEQAYSPIRTAWNDALEKEFQDLRALEPAMLDYDTHAENRTEWLRAAPAEKWNRMWDRYEQLRFSRLCYLLRAREPAAQIGYSINIYRLSAADISAVMGGAHAWRSAIQRQQSPPGHGI